MQDKNFKIFIDFDGTITEKDVGEGIFREFGNPEIVNRTIVDLLYGKISSRQCWEILCESTGRIDQNILDEFISTFKIEYDFNEFINFCTEKNFEVFVLSDGFDYYLEKLFEKENLSHLKHYANNLEITDGKLIPFFPFYDPGFLSSANCKRNHILNNSSDKDYTVFIGDGNSDKDAVHFADFIFAKNDLLKYCESERITFFPFKNFSDVSSRLIQLMNKKRLKKRHRAQLNRREAYIIEN